MMTIMPGVTVATARYIAFYNNARSQHAMLHFQQEYASRWLHIVSDVRPQASSKYKQASRNSKESVGVQ